MSENAILSGWRGDVNGAIRGTSSEIRVKLITLDLDAKTAFALCNILTRQSLETNTSINKMQIEPLAAVGAAIGQLIDHGAAKNMEEKP